MNAFRSAVVPAAGLGTRFLPATKTVPKELLPVVDTPGIELVAEEAKAAGADMVDVNAGIPGKQILAGIAVVVAVLFIVTAIVGRWRLPVIGTAALIIISAYAPSGIPSFLYSNY